MSNIRKASHAEVAPLIDDNCTALVLGSMLSPKSAQARFYYAHPQNRFWRVIAAIFDCEYPNSFDDKAALALSHGIALWDVIKSCDIVGASDSTIKNVEFNDINGLLTKYKNIKQIYTTGGTAYKLLSKYSATVDNSIIADAIALPSTSPQNCKVTLPELVSAYSVIAIKNARHI